MIFSDSWDRKKVVLPPTQKIFIFGPCGGPLRGPKGPEGKSQNPHMAEYDFISSVSTSGMGLNHVPMIFSDSLTPKMGVVI